MPLTEKVQRVEFESYRGSVSWLEVGRMSYPGLKSTTYNYNYACIGQTIVRLTLSSHRVKVVISILEIHVRGSLISHSGFTSKNSCFRRCSFCRIHFSEFSA